jgi:hypothetical protein
MERKRRKRLRDPHRSPGSRRGERTPWWLVLVVVVLVIAFLARRLAATSL